MPSAKRPEPITLGWREWVALPDWDVANLKAKIDTGARTSSLHAFGLEWFDRSGSPWVRFQIHPWQRSTADAVVAEGAVIATRNVRSSSGEVEHRPVVHATLVLAGQPVTAEVTLTRRDEMGFRMLVGREALRQRFLVDPAVSYLGGRPARSIRRRNRGDEPIMQPLNDAGGATAPSADNATPTTTPTNTPTTTPATTPTTTPTTTPAPTPTRRSRSPRRST